MTERISEGGTWGRYRLGERLGIGGMAEVFRAVSPGAAGFEKPVVIKRILPEYVEDKNFVSMFVNEARIGATLAHPNIVQIYDFGEVDGEYFMSMEYVHGTDLARFLWRLLQRKRTVPGALVAFIGIDVLRALEFAHNRMGPDGKPSPVIHRDVSPQNILISMDGMVKLADFGLARALDHARLTRPGTLKGKLSYMSPEQAFGREMDPRSDVFSLGIVMYELLAGKSLFRGSNDADTLARVRSAAVPQFEKFVPNVDPLLGTALRRSLAREPEDRFASASEFRRALLDYLRTVTPAVEASQLSALVREVIAKSSKPPQATHDATDIGGNVVVDVAETPTAILDPERDAGSAPDGPWVEGPAVPAVASPAVAAMVGSPVVVVGASVQVGAAAPVLGAALKATTPTPGRALAQAAVSAAAPVPVLPSPKMTVAEPPTLIGPAEGYDIPVTPPHGSAQLPAPGVSTPAAVAASERDSDEKVTLYRPGPPKPASIVVGEQPLYPETRVALAAGGEPDPAPEKALESESDLPSPPSQGPGILALALIGLGLLFLSALITWAIVSP